MEVWENGENWKNLKNCGRDVRPARLDHVNFYRYRLRYRNSHITSKISLSPCSEAIAVGLRAYQKIKKNARAIKYPLG